MRSKKSAQALRRVLRRVLPLVPVGREVRKRDFERLHGEILACVVEATGASRERVAGLLEGVLGALPREYGQRPAEENTWPALITHLYESYVAAVESGERAAGSDAAPGPPPGGGE